ncbi:hypothetical protein [Silvibacterium acidisoli]|uniref:hypothetical protein n=1 Tax=Acidobacteriaceae bacterium ZG23-2 TaxID=2883246 RepID=UPI00406D0D34
MAYSVKVEYADARKMRTRNKRYYRAAHWPIWIWVFFLAPGPMTFALFEHGGSVGNLIWLGVVLLGTGIAALCGQLPGSEPAPYILRFTEDRPNPLYRRVCYTFAWNALLNFAILNWIGLAVAIVTGKWYLKQIYAHGYTPICITVILLGLFGVLPRVRRSTKGEGWERRYFYGTVWAVTAGQVVLLVLWKTLPRTHMTDIVKLAVYSGVLVMMGILAALGQLPRTRPILPGELMVAD